MDLALSDRSVLVLAGTSGLGLASASAVASEGATVTVASRSATSREDAIEHLESVAAGQVRAVDADITSREDIEALIDGTVAETGRLDHVIASTGGPTPGDLESLSDQDWYDAFDLLTMSLVWTIDAAEAHLKASPGGSIVAITSTSVREPIDGLALSNVVRRSVIGLVKTAADELAPDVRVNALLPGPFETARIEEILERSIADGTYDDREEASAAWTEDIPLGRLGDPAELGAMAAVLASDRASFVTGACLPVDGGRLRS